MSCSATVILGAADPEMEAIETLLRKTGVEFRYALNRAGERVTPTDAYTAVAFTSFPDDELTCRVAVEDCILVECDFPGRTPAGRIDHHRPGDPGYGRPPAEFWQASSIGQVATLLGFEIPCPEFTLTAAADHCLAAAYAGQCPGVTVEAITEWGVQQMCRPSAASSRNETRTPDQVRASLERAKAAICAAPIVTIGDVPVVDLRGQQIPDLPAAAVMLGIAYLAGGVALREGDSAKIVLGGCGQGTIPGTAPVEAFLQAAQMGNVAGTPVYPDGDMKPYGDPVRGFAGAYKK